MDDAEAHDLYPVVGASARPKWVGGHGGRRKAWAEPPSIQILVVVANIQMRNFKNLERKPEEKAKRRQYLLAVGLSRCIDYISHPHLALLYIYIYIYAHAYIYAYI